VPGWNVVTPPPTVTGMRPTAVPHPTACPCDPSGPIPAGQTPNGPKPSGGAPGLARSRARRPPRATPIRTTAHRPVPGPVRKLVIRPGGVSRPPCSAAPAPGILAGLLVPVILVGRGKPEFPVERAFLAGQVSLAGQVFRARTQDGLVLAE
jgi:hypothetical protein